MTNENRQDQVLDQLPDQLPGPVQQPKGGWFTVAVVTLLIVWPIAAFAMFHAQWSSMAQTFPVLKGNASWHSFSLQLWLLLALATALQVLAGWRLVYRRKWRSVRFAIVVIWTVKVGFSLAKSWLVAQAFGEFGSREWADLLVQCCLGGLVAGAWTWYLLKSRRVRALFP